MLCPAGPTCRLTANEAERARCAERDARIAARAAQRRAAADRVNAPRADEPLTVAECGALIWTPPNVLAEPLSFFHSYTFAHYGRTLYVLHNTISGDIGLARHCRGPTDADEFTPLVGGRFAMLATLAVRDGADKARILMYRTEILTNPGPIRAFAAVIRRVHPDLSFGAIPVASEWMGYVSDMTFRSFMEMNLRSEALRVADRELLAEAERRYAAAVAAAAALKPHAAPAPLGREGDDRMKAAVAEAVAAAVRRAIVVRAG